MENSRFWIFLSLGVAAMLAMKYVASPDADIIHWKNGWHTSYDVDDGSIDARRLHAHATGVPAPRPSLAGLSSMRHTTSASASAVPAKLVKKDDKKAVKKDDGKKKKTKKKSDVFGSEMPFTNQLPLATDGSTKSPAPSAPAYTGPSTAPSYTAAGGPNPSVSATTNPHNLSLHDWEDLLIKNPSYDETVKFIKAYQAKSVTSDIFYAIVNEMLASKTQVLNQYGVQALQATPSVTSLSALVAINTTTTTTVSAQVSTALQAYQAISYLGVLKSTLTTTEGSESFAKVLNLVLQSATKNLTTTTTGTEPGASGGASATNKTAFASVLSELKSLETTAAETNRASITAAIDTLQAYGVTDTSTGTSKVAEANRGDYLR